MVLIPAVILVCAPLLREMNRLLHIVLTSPTPLALVALQESMPVIHT